MLSYRVVQTGNIIRQRTWVLIEPVAPDEVELGRLKRVVICNDRYKRSNLKSGIFGEHAGDALSIAFYEELGLDHISCSPSGVPVARLAAA